MKPENLSAGSEQLMLGRVDDDEITFAWDCNKLESILPRSIYTFEHGGLSVLLTSRFLYFIHILGK